MCETRTSMIDLQIDPLSLNDPGKRAKIIQDIQDVFQQLYLKKKYEDTYGESHVVNFSNECGRFENLQLSSMEKLQKKNWHAELVLEKLLDAALCLTCFLKTYPFGLITLTFEDSFDDTPFTNPKLEDIRKLLYHKLKVRTEKIPIVKRGSAVPLYFTTADERLLEYDFDKVIFEEDSPFQNIKILHSPTLGNCLMLDDLQNLAESDINYTHGVMKHGVLPYAGREVLILGGGDGGLLHELLKENPKFVTMVDQMVIDACREHLRGCCGDSLDMMEGPHHKIIIDDCLKMLDIYRNEGKKFDVIINDLTDIPIATSPQGELWDFIKKIIIKSLAVLKDDGSYLNHALGEGCIEALKTYENMLMNLPVKVKFESHSAYVPSFMENWVFYEIKKD